jgi:hypothetical protein
LIVCNIWKPSSSRNPTASLRWTTSARSSRVRPKKLDADFVEDREAGLRPQVREIIFGNTPDFRLYNNAFILRRRISFVDGFPVSDPEIVFKFHHPDEQKATVVDVRGKIAGKYRIKFKAEALPLKDEVGGYRIFYSHNCQFGLSQMHEADRTSMATLVKVFPALAGNEKISLVNGGIVEEVLLPLGQLDFGKGVVAKCDIDRAPIGRLLHHGKRRDLRCRNCSDRRWCLADPAALQDQPGSTRAGRGSDRSDLVHA